MAALFSFSCLLLILLATGVYATAAVDNVPNTEETIADNLPLAFKQNKLASKQLVEFYLEKLYRQNPKMKGVIEAQENALNLADQADREREYKERVLSFSRLHGINPALVKLEKIEVLKKAAGLRLAAEKAASEKLARKSAAAGGSSFPFEKIGILSSSASHTDTANADESFSIIEATVDDIKLAFTQNQVTSRQLVQSYINRINSLNPELHGVIEVNPDALSLADKADRERRDKEPVSFSRLHGIPVLVKDIFDTKDKMNTTAGSFALPQGSVVPRDAGVVTKLRNAGAIILGKASLSEWSGFRGYRQPPGWSARGDYGVNPYDSNLTPCGSSSGSAISAAASFATVTIGSETDGSILCPSSLNSVVGIKPTVGLTSRAGVIPISPRQDSVGPICRTVSDAVYVLDAIAGLDNNDAATVPMSKYIPSGGYAQFLKRDGLRGKRLGIVRHPFFEFSSAEVRNAFEAHFNKLRQEGATVIDNLQITNVDEILSDENTELTALTAEFKISLNLYLSNLMNSPVRTLADAIDFNNRNKVLEMIDEYGQELFVRSQGTSGIGTKEREAIDKLARQTREGFVKLMETNNLDAVVAGPGGSNFPESLFPKILAIGGLPGITVPAGYTNQNKTPLGIFFGGLNGTEPKLIEIAYAFEQATKARIPPTIKRLKYQTH